MTKEAEKRRLHGVMKSDLRAYVGATRNTRIEVIEGDSAPVLRQIAAHWTIPEDFQRPAPRRELLKHYRPPRKVVEVGIEWLQANSQRGSKAQKNRYRVPADNRAHALTPDQRQMIRRLAGSKAKHVPIEAVPGVQEPEHLRKPARILVGEVWLDAHF